MDKKKTQAFFEGRELEAYNLFGAHPKKTYTEFTLWAPHAKSISVIGDFNKWDVEADPMTKDETGIWSAKVKGAKPGQSYKYHVEQSTGDVVDKIDPFAFFSELRPQTASVIADLTFKGWTDKKWMDSRTKGFDDPLSIYELHLGSWKRPEEMGPNEFPKYLDIVDDLIAHCKKFHFTHVEVMPLCEHPFDGSWGYQDTAYFSTTSRYGTNVELMQFVNKLHEAGIGIIMDFVPVHFVKDNFALARFDGTPLYEYSNPDDANSEWGTANFDLWKEEVRSFLMSAANYWLDIYHMDGLRWDAISNAIFWKGNKDRGVNEGACDFMKRTNFMINEKYKGKVMLIAEDSTDFPNVTKSTLDGGLGFDYKWDLGWMNDTLKYLKRDPIYRQYHHNDITFSMAYFYSERFILPFSHDEVVHGKATIVDKMWGSYEDKFAQCRALYTYMFTHPGKKLNFMGNEIGMLREWDEQKSTDWFLLQYPMHDALAQYFADLSGLYADNDAYYYGYNPLNFKWIDADDAGRNMYVFMRIAKDKTFVTVLNFSTNPYKAQFGVPHKGVYTEVMNTQWAKYNGSLSHNNVQQVKALRLKRNNQPYMIEVDVPPLGAQIFEVSNEVK